MPDLQPRSPPRLRSDALNDGGSDDQIFGVCIHRLKRWKTRFHSSNASEEDAGESPYARSKAHLLRQLVVRLGVCCRTGL